MEFLYRTKPPTYQGPGRTQKQRPTTRAGFLEGLWCAVVGGLFRRSLPTYRTPPSDSCPEVPPVGGPPTGEDCSCEPDVEPRGEIHIYPGG